MALGQTWVAPLVALALLGRWLMALYLGLINEIPWRPFLLFWVLAADVLLLGAFLKALGRREVIWRGRTYRLAPGGSIEDVQ